MVSDKGDDDMIRSMHGNQEDSTVHRTTGKVAQGDAGTMRALEQAISLEKLKPGDQFKCAFDPRRTGIVLNTNRCSVTVREYGKGKAREFKTGEGETATFVERAHPVEWAGSAQVIMTGHSDVDLRSPAGSREAIMADRSLEVRWRYQIKMLKDFLSAENPEMAESVRGRLLSIAREAEQKGLKLTKADFDDPVFVGIEGLLVESKGNGNGGQGKRANGGVSKGKAEARKEEKEMAKQGKKVPKKAHGGKKEGKLSPRADNDCLCGCGSKVAGRFKMGHDATYKSLILKVQRGKLEVKALPKKMQGELKFVGAGKGLLRCTNAQAKIPQ